MMDSNLSIYWNDLFAWGGTILVLVGAKLISDGNKAGWYVSIVSRILWLIWTWRLSQAHIAGFSGLPIGVACFLIIVISVRAAYIRYRQDKLVGNKSISDKSHPVV